MTCVCKDYELKIEMDENAFTGAMNVAKNEVFIGL